MAAPSKPPTVLDWVLIMSEKEKKKTEKSDHEKQCDKWRKGAYRCHKSKTEGHNWFPVSKVITDTSEHVTMMMCGLCFHAINVSEIHKFMEPIPS